MPPVSLSDDELQMIMTACRPLAVRDRDAFLQAVAAVLKDCAEIGPGAVHRAIAATQRQFFDPPRLEGNGRMLGVGKYAR